MRVFLFGMMALLGACSTSIPPLPGERLPDLPFPVERGSALPPPGESRAGQTAPPEGRGPGGVDFGQWRQADPAVYSPAFQTQIGARLAGKSGAEQRADLEANGFRCEDGAERLECRIEIMERSCAFDWYVVVEHTGAASPAPIAGLDLMCLGAN